MSTSCRLQELLRRPIFPTISLLPPTASFASSESLNPHLTQILANNEHRLSLAQQRIQCHSQSHPSPVAPPQPPPPPHSVVSNQLQHQAKRRYSCTQCPYSTDRRDLFRRHENIHRDEKPFRCYVCNKMFNRADHVKKHFLRIHKGLEYDVKLTKRIKGVDYDVKDNSSGSGSNNKCFPLLPSPYVYNNGMHLTSIPPPPPLLKEEQLFKVEKKEPLAALSLPQSIADSEHRNAGQFSNRSSPPSSESDTSVDYECEFCGCAFINYPSLHTHRYLLHRYVNDLDNCYTYRCVLCGQRSITQRAMMQHMLRHSSTGCTQRRATSVQRKTESLDTIKSKTVTQKVNSNSNPSCGNNEINNNSESDSANSTKIPLTISSRNRRKQSQPKKIVKSVVNVIDDLYEVEKCERNWIASKFSCKICHKHFSTYTQQIQHQMFFKHYH
ncbi:hypothetical protein B4U79_12308 [Dinothrombium tinctorium]|uniref:C2H2-type domain-containing protein n=1 Tax=Dinothrombium tinctorium TaxID=1965070 RepID=A0A443R5A7_9ACAR|nr:hypothetical protein B4U79_12308 [Dinothrombium tinctorium]